jgi:hypothetical protein
MPTVIGSAHHPRAKASHHGNSRSSARRCTHLPRAERNLDPLAAQRAHLELYVRWCQEVRRFKPSTVSRRTSVVFVFFRTCFIDGLLEHSPAEWLRRPTVPLESPTPAAHAAVALRHRPAARVGRA